jgi:hypothetical protein
MRFRTVGGDETEAYRDAARAAGVAAAAGGAHFWAFELDGDEDVYVEFLEGPSDEDLARLHEATRESLRMASGGDPTAYQIGASGVRSTEFS